MFPNFIGIGAAKSGTTWITQCLKDHPQVYLPPQKETMFFSSSYDESRLDEYKKYFPNSVGFKAMGEFSVDYFDFPEAPARIARHLPNARLLLSLRNPVDQIYSHYWHLNRQNFHSWDANNRYSFEEALITHKHRLLSPANYFEHITHWLHYFEREQIHIILYRDICEDPAREVKKLFDFLEVDKDFVPSSLHIRGASVRQGVSPRNYVMDKLHAHLYEILSQKVYMPLKRGIGLRNAAALKEKLRVRRVLQSIFYKEGYPQMRSETRAALSRDLAPQIDALSELLQKDLSYWLAG